MRMKIETNQCLDCAVDCRQYEVAGNGGTTLCKVMFCIKKLPIVE